MELASLIVNSALSVITIVAIVGGPMWALQKQRQLDNERERHTRQLNLFKTLMSFRATPVSLPFVQALNLIDVEFDGPKEQGVRNAWKRLLPQFNQDMNKEENVLAVRELTTELLVAIGNSLGYPFDKEYLQSAGYYPNGLVWVEQQQNALRFKLLEVLDGQRRVPVGVFEDKFPAINPPQDGKAAGPNGKAAGGAQ
jgi:uncharacterized protein DUF6680